MERVRRRFAEWPAFVYWDVEVVDDSGDEDVIVASHERVLVSMCSDAKRITLKDVNDDVVATFTGDADGRSHSACLRRHPRRASGLPGRATTSAGR